MVRKQVKALTVLYLFPCQHFGVYFAPYQILLVMGAVFVLLAIPFLLFYDRTVLQRMPAAAGMRLYANGYRPVMDALLPLLFYCVLPCVVLKSFCIEYSAKGAVKLAVSSTAGAGVLLLSMAVSWLFFRKDPMAADRHGAHHCECGSHRQQHRGICPASGAGFFLRCADGLSEHTAVTDHAAGDAQPGCRIGLCLSLKITNRKQETR